MGRRGRSHRVIIEAMFPGGGPIMGWWGPCPSPIPGGGTYMRGPIIMGGGRGPCKRCPEFGGGGVVGGVGEGAGDIPCKELVLRAYWNGIDICF